MPRILIFANGELPHIQATRALIGKDDLLIAADGGTRHILALGLTPHIIIGDLDSTDVDIRPLEKRGTRIIGFPTDKDATDLELAINHALTLNPTEIIVVAALGGRVDQMLGNISLLVTPYSSLVTLDDGVDEIFFCRDQVNVRGGRGDIVSLVPWGNEVRGVLTQNLRWPLLNESLYPNKTRGISNEMLGEEASVKIESGLLLVIHHRANLQSPISNLQSPTSQIP